MKDFFVSLKSDVCIKWKELLVLLLINIFELFALSSSLVMMPAWKVIVFSAVLLFPALALIIMCIIENKADKQDVKILFLFIALSLLFGVIKSYLYVCSLFLAYLFYKDKKTMYKWLFIISIFCLFSFVIGAMLRIIPDNPMLRHDDVWVDVTHVRHTFGFNHPNHILKYIMTSVIFGYMYMGDKKLPTFIFSVIMLIVTLWLGWLTNCRTGMLVISATLLIMNLPFLVTWFKAKRLMFAFILVSFIMIAFKDIEWINEELSGRPYLFNLFFEAFPEYILMGKYYVMTLIKDFSVESYVSLPLDNDFLMTIFDGGLIALLVISYLFYIAFEDNKDKKVIVVLIGIFTYALTEAFELVFTYPLFIMMFVELIDKYMKNKDNIKLFKVKEIKENNENKDTL